MLEHHELYGDAVATPDTAFAPAARASRSEIESAIALLQGNPLLKALLDATDVSVVVLNRQRQILVGNAVLLSALGVPGCEELEGARPGEALGCVHAWDAPGGCGTSAHCATCGAVLAILESQRADASVEKECLLTVRRPAGLEAFELRVKASQVTLGGDTLTVVGLRDISAEKRRAVLERVFLHDLANTVSPLLLSAEMLAARASAGADDGVLVQRIAELTRRLCSEIEDQRVLLQAEVGSLELTRAAIAPEHALAAAAGLVRGHPVAAGRTLEIASGGGGVVTTDEGLLVRVLVNMLKNALEATPAGGAVRAWIERGPESCTLLVRNPGVMEGRVALQIFKRSFSTKPGRGRGLGTFSMKLLGERYLGGTVGFTTAAAEGTTFFIRLPALR